MTSAENLAKGRIYTHNLGAPDLLGKANCTHGVCDSKKPRKELGPPAPVFFPLSCLGAKPSIFHPECGAEESKTLNFYGRFLPVIYPLAVKLWADHSTSLCQR